MPDSQQANCVHCGGVFLATQPSHTTCRQCLLLGHPDGPVEQCPFCQPARPDPLSTVYDEFIKDSAKVPEVKTVDELITLGGKFYTLGPAQAWCDCPDGSSWRLEFGKGYVRQGGG